MHRRNDQDLSRTLLGLHDGRDLAIALGVGEARATKLMDDPCCAHAQRPAKIFGESDILRFKSAAGVITGDGLVVKAKQLFEHDRPGITFAHLIGRGQTGVTQFAARRGLDGGG